MGALSAMPALVDDGRRQSAPSAPTQSLEILIKGARCANCIAKIEAGVKALPGIGEARLNLSTGKLSVATRSGAAAMDAILTRIRDLGYAAQPFEAEASLSADEAEGRLLLRCLAVAGFGTVFLVGLSDAIDYGGGDLGPALREGLFRLAALVAIPITLYAGQPFWLSAWGALSKRQANMDVPIGAALILSLGLSLYQTFSHGGETYFDAAAMLAFLLLIGRYLDFRLRDRARGAARHLLAMQSQLARRIAPDGTAETVAAKALAAGDVILLATGERALVNGVLEEGGEFDTSLVTGESVPRPFAAGAALEAGSILLGAPVRLRASAGIADSLVADLARLLEAGQQSRSSYVRLADRAARAYVPLVTILAVSVFVGWLLAGVGLAHAATNAIAVLIITCPCALGLAVPAVQVVATGRLFQRGLFVKSGDALERLAEIEVAVFDKTGTLTENLPQLENKGKIAPEVLEQAARLARASHHPLAKALAAAAGDGPVMPVVVERAGQGMQAVEGGHRLRLGSASWCEVDNADPSMRLWFRDGDAAPIGFAFREALKVDAPAMLAELNRLGIEIHMLTGDHPARAATIAREAGIDRWLADVGPRAKAEHIQALRDAGIKVLMVGDGINDAAAMALAHVSIAPGTASDVSQLASDMVLRGAGLAPVAEAVKVARAARRLALQNFALALAYNLTAIPMAAMGFVTPVIASATMAGSSLLVTLNALRLAR